MAETKKAEATETKKAEATEERVDLFIPRGSVNDEPTLLISINGVNYLLPKGKTSNVPKAVKEEYDRAQRAQARLDATIDELLAKANEDKTK